MCALASQTMLTTSAKRASAAAGLRWASLRRQLPAHLQMRPSSEALRQLSTGATARALVQARNLPTVVASRICPSMTLTCLSMDIQGISCNAAPGVQLLDNNQQARAALIGQLAAVAAVAVAVAATSASTADPSRAEAASSADSPPSSEKVPLSIACMSIALVRHSCW